MITVGCKREGEEELLDLELADLSDELRWREWMNRIEAVLFANAGPVDCDALSRVVGQGAKIDLLIDDIQADFKGKPYVIVPLALGWMFRSRAQYAAAIRTAADLGEQTHDFSKEEMSVLCTVAKGQKLEHSAASIHLCFQSVGW